MSGQIERVSTRSEYLDAMRGVVDALHKLQVVWEDLPEEDQDKLLTVDWTRVLSDSLDEVVWDWMGQVDAVQDALSK